MKKTVTGNIFDSKRVMDWKSRVNMFVDAGNYASAITYLNERCPKAERNSAAWYLLADIHNKQMDFASALVAIDEALKIDATYESLRLKAIVLSNLKSYDQSIPLAEKMYSGNREDIGVINVLKVGYFNSGNHDKAMQYGRILLELWDKAAGYEGDGFLPGNDRQGRGGKKVVSYSLWGKSQVYNIGAMVNARQVQAFLPGWVSRFYVGEDVPKHTVADLEKMGAEIIRAENSLPDTPRYSWRFLVADDPTVEYFLCRDCDSRFSPKESAAVQEWLNSGDHFHIMRDHILHTDPILAGMWGGRGGTGLNIQERIRDPKKNYKKNHYHADQIFLANELWPLIRSHAMIHDSYYDLFGARPFPLYGKGTDAFHVGMGIKSLQALNRERKTFGITFSSTVF